MPAPHFHLTFGSLVEKHPGVPGELARACRVEPVYTRLGSIFHDLPYYGNMLIEALRYGLESAAVDEPWAYRMHSVRPDRFYASFIRAARTTTAPLTMEERLALVGGMASHCALDLALHPLVNYCARRDAIEMGGHESWRHRQAEIVHAIFFHQAKLGRDPIASGDIRRLTRIVKEGSVVRKTVEPELIVFMRDAYSGAYGDAPDGFTWARWLRNFRQFGHVVANPLAVLRTSQALRKGELRERYFDNDVFRFWEFYACAERRLTELTQLAYDYFVAGDFSSAAESAFCERAKIDDLAEPTPMPGLPPLPKLAPVRRYRLARPGQRYGQAYKRSSGDPASRSGPLDMTT